MCQQTVSDKNENVSAGQPVHSAGGKVRQTLAASWADKEKAEEVMHFTLQFLFAKRQKCLPHFPRV